MRERVGCGTESGKDEEAEYAFSAFGTAEGKLDAVFTLAGALVGALLFSLIYPSLDAWLLQNANLGKITIVDLIGIEGVYLAIPFSLMLLALAFFILKDRYDTEH